MEIHIETQAELWAQACRAHEAGAWAQSEQLCRRLLQADPACVDALHLLGNLCLTQGRLEEAVAYYEQSLRLRPRHALGHNNLGIARVRQGNLAEATACFRQALRIDPGYVKAYNNLGAALCDLGELDEAVACLEQATRLDPQYTDAQRNWEKAQAGRRRDASPHVVRKVPDAQALNREGAELAQAGKLEEAQRCFYDALQLRPDFAEAANNLGNVLAALTRHEEAVPYYRRAVALKPDYANAWHNLGHAYFAMKDLGQAIDCYERALQCQPKYPQAHNSLALVLAEQRHWDEAVGRYRQALEQDPDFPDAHNNLARVLADQERPEEALKHFDEAIRLRPDYADARWSRALTLLFLGDFERGWAEYEWRWRRPGAAQHPFRQPLWDGKPLHGRTIVLHAEQGLGDTLQFVRYVPLVKERGGNVVLRCPPLLLMVLQNCPGIDRLVGEHEALPACDCQAPLLSLPFLFRTTLDSIPTHVPYLLADPARVAYWQAKLAGIDGLKVGIAWQGNPHHRRDCYRSIPLASFAPLADVPNVRLISLQKGAGSEQVAALKDRFPILEVSDPLDLSPAAFAETAALLRNLDLVVTADTAIAHLAGAIAVPVWLALSTLPDWRWLRKGQDSPWYPSMRLFRQRGLGDWSELFVRIATALKSISHQFRV